jgi:hypothetical protein
MKQLYKTKMMIGAALASFALAPAAHADDPQAGDKGAGKAQKSSPQRPQAQAKQASAKQRANGDAMQRTRKLREVSGTVIATKSVQLRGTEERNLIALLRTNRGNDRLVVDLGPASKINRDQVKEGGKLAAQGVVVRVGDQQFLAATHIKAGDQTMKVDRSAQQNMMQRRGGAASGQQGGSQRQSGQGSGTGK